MRSLKLRRRRVALHVVLTRLIAPGLVVSPLVGSLPVVRGIGRGRGIRLVVSPSAVSPSSAGSGATAGSASSSRHSKSPPSSAGSARSRFGLGGVPFRSREVTTLSNDRFGLDGRDGPGVGAANGGEERTHRGGVGRRGAAQRRARPGGAAAPVRISSRPRPGREGPVPKRGVFEPRGPAPGPVRGTRGVRGIEHAPGRVLVAEVVDVAEHFLHHLRLASPSRRSLAEHLLRRVRILRLEVVVLEVGESVLILLLLPLRLRRGLLLGGRSGGGRRRARRAELRLELIVGTSHVSTLVRVPRRYHALLQHVRRTGTGTGDVLVKRTPYGDGLRGWPVPDPAARLPRGFGLLSRIRASQRPVVPSRGVIRGVIFRLDGIVRLLAR